MPRLMLTPARLVAILLWIAVTVGVALDATGLLPPLNTWLQLAAIAYILLIMGLIWRDTPAPTARERAPKAVGFWPALALVLAAHLLLFFVARYFHPWFLLAVASGLIGIWAIWTERRRVTPLAVAVALVAGLVCLGLNAASGRVSTFQAIYLGLVPAMFLGGTLLVWRLDLTRVASAEGDWGAALGLFGWGVVLAVPPALLNIAVGAHLGDRWVDSAWEPLVALSPGIAEEAMARLLLLTVCFFVLSGRRGVSSKTALAAAVLIAAFAHGLAHVDISALFGPAGGMMVLASLLFGVPMGLIFVRFGFEAAVAYHFFIDFVRFLAAYLTL